MADVQFRVYLSSMKMAPYVGPTGFARAATFYIRSAAPWLSRRVDGGLVGGETLRRCESLQAEGQAFVTVTDHWLQSHELDWPTKVVDLALEQFAA